MNPINMERLDILLSKQEAITREVSKKLILQGQVTVNDKIITKPGQKFSDEEIINYSKPEINFLSQGGFKLFKALQEFNLNVTDKICLDIGASTGGFTDCMLQHGAKKVYAVDSGTNQLHKQLLENEKVISMENTNARYLTADNFMEQINFCVVDVSFISLTKVLKTIFEILDNQGEVVCLVKPQFEAGKNNIGKNGVVKDKKIHLKVLSEICNFAKETGFKILGLTFSPVKGAKGNIEFLIYLCKSGNNILIDNKFLLDLVSKNK